MPYKNIELSNKTYNIQNTEKNSQIYKGFSTVDSQNFGSKLFDFELIKQDILNQFNTRKGQRVMNPQFGSIIWDLLMEPLTPRVKEVLTKDIKTICNSDPRTFPIQIGINETEQGYLIEITLGLKNTNQTSTLKMLFDKKIGLIA